MHLKPYRRIGDVGRNQEFHHPYRNQTEMHVMNIKPPNLANTHPAANLPPPRPAPATGQGSDFSQMLKAAQSESAAPSSTTQG